MNRLEVSKMKGKTLKNSAVSSLDEGWSPLLVEYISQQLDDIIRQEGLSERVDKTNLLDTIMRLTPPDSLNIPEEELQRRLRAVVLWEAAFGMLNEMTPEEIKQFDEAVKRRSLFE